MNPRKYWYIGRYRRVCHVVDLPVNCIFIKAETQAQASHLLRAHLLRQEGGSRGVPMKIESVTLATREELFAQKFLAQYPEIGGML